MSFQEPTYTLSNAALVTKLFLSLQTRPEADIDDFFPPREPA